MNKIQSDNESFFTRSGSFATHGSRSGNNLLGWGDAEVLTDIQQREALLKAKVKLDADICEIRKSLKGTTACEATNKKRSQIEKLASKSAYIAAELSKFKQTRPKNPDVLGDYIIRVVRSKMTNPQWKSIVDEARELFANANSEPKHDQ